MPLIYEGQAIRERQAIRVAGGLLSGDGVAADMPALSAARRPPP